MTGVIFLKGKLDRYYIATRYLTDRSQDVFDLQDANDAIAEQAIKLLAEWSTVAGSNYNPPGTMYAEPLILEGYIARDTGKE